MIKSLWNLIQPLVWPRNIEEFAPAWRVVIDNFRISSQDFYATVDEQIRQRELPGVTVKRLSLQQAGLLSDEREYLCIARERFRLELCAAPFGKTFFFSLRSMIVPPRINWIVLLILVASFGWLLLQSTNFYGFWLGLFIVFSGIFAVIRTLRSVGKLGWESVDAALLNSRFVGGLYEIYFRRDTYFRQDARSVFFHLIETIVKETAQATTLSNGVRIPHDVLQPPINVLLGSRRGLDPVSESMGERSP